VLGNHSGRNALAQRYRALGFELDADEVERTYKLFKLLADRKKEIHDEDLLAILHHGVMDDAPEQYRLRGLEVVCGGPEARAQVVIENDGREQRAFAAGDGPIAASFAAIDSLVDHRVELEDLVIHAITTGEDAVGEVTLRAQVDGRTFTGRGASPDVVNGAVRAYLHALNKAAQARALEARILERESYLWGV